MPKTLNICASLIQYSGSFEEWNEANFKEKINFLEVILKKIRRETDLLILPAGFFNCKTSTYSKVLFRIEQKVKELISQYSPQLSICSGIDGSNRSEHIGVTVNKRGIISIARKFHHMNNYVKIAEGPFECEKQMKRVFKIKDRKAYIAVCYDTFGINQLNLENEENADFIISLVHIFNKTGKGASATDFARKGLAGAAKKWGLNVYASAVFAENRNAQNWPAGVRWTHGNASVRDFNFHDIRIKSKPDIVYLGDSTIYLNYYKE